MELLDKELYGNAFAEYVDAFLIFIVLILIFRIFRKLILAKLETLATKTKSKIDDRFIKAISAIHPRFYDLLALYCALHRLVLNPVLERILGVIALAIVIIQGVIISKKIIEYFLHRSLGDDEKTDHHQTMLSGIGLLLNIGLWGTGLLLFLSNIGINVSSLAASLGIGGIAVALAAQNVLGDLFSSFSIYADKPFRVGDSITIGVDSGTVEKIGLKTTRIRSVNGEELIISNRELTTARIQNFKRLRKRRALLNLTISYDTAPEKVSQISEMIKDIITTTTKTELDRVTLKEFGNLGLVYEIVYHHLSDDYNESMITRETICLKVFEELNKLGIELATLEH